MTVSISGQRATCYTPTISDIGSDRYCVLSVLIELLPYPVEIVSVRTLAFLAVALLLAGCGTSVASSPTPTPKPTPYREPGARWDHPPKMTIDRNAHYTATVVTSLGNFTITLEPKIAPITVNNFVFLARNRYYVNNQFTRVYRNFVIQTGDPTNTGTGGPGYAFQDEPVKEKYTLGTVAMANRGPDTNGSQFFIVVGAEAAKLPPNYTIFGHVTSGMSTVLAISVVPVQQNIATGELSQPVNPVVVKSITIHETK